MVNKLFIYLKWKAIGRKRRAPELWLKQVVIKMEKRDLDPELGKTWKKVSDLCQKICKQTFKFLIASNIISLVHKYKER